MARSFEELRKKLPLKSQKLAAARTQDLLQEMALHELQWIMQLSKEDTDETLGEGNSDDAQPGLDFV